MLTPESRKRAAAAAAASLARRAIGRGLTFERRWGGFGRPRPPRILMPLLPPN
jgi:hypothetical protein